MKKKFVFVILHYLTIDDTVKCIESIQNFENNYNIEIVIVDNGSNNNTGNLLKEKYKDNNLIHIIINDKNLGFARGNNVGFIYAKNNLNPDFIIMCNNDTYLIQSCFFDLINKEFKNSKFAVLGPKILLKNDVINPVLLTLPSISELKKQLRNFIIDYILTYIYMDGIYINLRSFLKKILIKLGLKKEHKVIDNKLYNFRHENIVLHGCFLIFSEIYINKFDGLDGDTFLYREEELLTKRLIDNKMKNVYNPELVIFHADDSSTNTLTKTKRNKKLFKDKNQIKSTKILLRKMNYKV